MHPYPSEKSRNAVTGVYWAHPRYVAAFSLAASRHPAASTGIKVSPQRRNRGWPTALAQTLRMAGAARFVRSIALTVPPSCHLLHNNGFQDRDRVPQLAPERKFEYRPTRSLHPSPSNDEQHTTRPAGDVLIRPKGR